MSLYSEFVKKHYASVAHMPAKERFKAIAEMWKAHKDGGMKMEAKPKKMAAKHKKSVKGGMAVGGLIVGGSEPSSPSIDRDVLGLRHMMF